MPIYQQLSTFRSGSGFSWSEVHFLQDADIGKALEDAESWGNRRLAVLASSYFLVSSRVSNVAVFRDAEDIEYTPAVGQGDFVTGAAAEDELPYDRLNVRIEATSRFRRTWKMGGIAGGILNTSGAYTPTAEFRAAFARLANYMLARGPNPPNGFYCLQQKGGNTRYNVATIAQSVNARCIVVSLVSTEGNITGLFPRGTQIRVSLCRSGTNVNGTWIVDQATFAGGTTNLITKPKNRFPYFANGFSTQAVVTTVPDPANSASYIFYTSIQPVRGAPRKTRGPFGQSRGRARAPIQI